MTVSVIVPVYKVEKWIDRCAHSLFSQTFPELEYIFVNDGTPDGSMETLLKVAAGYPDRKSHITIINNDHNKGLPFCRTVAVQRAVGDFVCFVDSDDWLEPDAIELLIKEQERTNADVIWGKAIMHTPDGEIVLQEPHYSNRHEWLLCYSRLTQGLVMVCWRRLIRRSLFTDSYINTAESGNYAEDKVIMTHLAYHAKSFSAIDDVVYHYNRMNGNALTAQQKYGEFNLDVFKKEIRSLLVIENFWKSKEEDVYYQEMVKAKLSFLMQRLLWALRCSSRQGYHAVKQHIDATSRKYYPAAGLDNWRSRLVYSHYFIAKAYWLFKSR